MSEAPRQDDGEPSARRRPGPPRRRWWIGLGLLVAAGAAAALVGIGTLERSPPPDVVVVLVDTLRADHLGTYGHERDTSPSIDALAERGVVFERAYAHSGWTLPSVASLLTGLYPAEHGAMRDPENHGSFGRVSEEAPSLPALMKGRGYRTGAFVNNVFLAPRFGLDRGFDRYDYRGSTNDEHRTAGVTVDTALEWLGQGDPKQPSFALVHFMEPHLDYAPPAELHGTFARDDAPVQPPVTARRVAELSEGQPPRPSPEEQEAIGRIYDEEIRAVDRAIGELAAALEERGRPTQLWITADHGEELWDHGRFEHGHHLHGELVRVPLVVTGPGLEPDRVLEPVQQVDLLRTLAGVAGAEAPEAARGLDLLEAIDDPGSLPPERPIAHEGCLYGEPCAALTSGRWRAVVRLPSSDSSLWRLDEHGQSDRRALDEAARDERLQPLLDELFELRGSRKLKRVDRAARSDLDQRELEQLRSLGYVR